MPPHKSAARGGPPLSPLATPLDINLYTLDIQCEYIGLVFNRFYICQLEKAKKQQDLLEKSFKELETHAQTQQQIKEEIEEREVFNVFLVPTLYLQLQ